MNVIETHDLGRRYGATWALQECSLTIPAGRLTALVGPNGAGKTTLLNLVMGLSTPSAGDLTVLGGLRPGSLPALDGIGFVAQDTPVYRGFSVARHGRPDEEPQPHLRQRLRPSPSGDLGHRPAASVPASSPVDSGPSWP